MFLKFPADNAQTGLSCILCSFDIFFVYLIRFSEAYNVFEMRNLIVVKYIPTGSHVCTRDNILSIHTKNKYKRYILLIISLISQSTYCQKCNDIFGNALFLVF